jgi:hypothetical protein
METQEQYKLKQTPYDYPWMYAIGAPLVVGGGVGGLSTLFFSTNTRWPLYLGLGAGAVSFLMVDGLSCLQGVDTGRPAPCFLKNFSFIL